MMWNYILAACMIILVYSVVSGYAIPAVFSGIALLALIKVGGVRLIARMKRK